MYKVLAAMHADMNEGRVWLTGSGYAPRSIIKITNKANNKSVFCEHQKIDHNFTKEYNQPPRVSIDPSEETVIINAWYREKLGGIPTKTSHDLKIVEANWLWGQFQALTGHPQTFVRLATWLATISVRLGVIGIVPGALSIYLAFK